jgi:hypothetical protein
MTFFMPKQLRSANFKKGGGKNELMKTFHKEDDSKEVNTLGKLERITPVGGRHQQR